MLCAREGCRIEAKRGKRERGGDSGCRGLDQAREARELLQAIERLRHMLQAAENPTDYHRHRKLHQELDRLIARWCDLNARCQDRGR
ncbi:MAG: hypothetical protein LOD85_06975 [Clostridia bacterium]|nr:hypothetical protein [Bacillota bacterium]